MAAGFGIRFAKAYHYRACFLRVLALLTSVICLDNYASPTVCQLINFVTLARIHCLLNMPTCCIHVLACLQSALLFCVCQGRPHDFLQGVQIASPESSLLLQGIMIICLVDTCAIPTATVNC